MKDLHPGPAVGRGQRIGLQLSSVSSSRGGLLAKSFGHGRLRPPEELHAPGTDKVGSPIHTDSQGAPNLPTYPARGYPPDTMIHSAIGPPIAPDLLPWLDDEETKIQTKNDSRPPTSPLPALLSGLCYRRLRSDGAGGLHRRFCGRRRGGRVTNMKRLPIGGLMERPRLLLLLLLQSAPPQPAEIFAGRGRGAMGLQGFSWA